jgi:hypothetical protein
MAISGMSGFHAASQQAALSHEKHGSRHSRSLTDVDAAGSSVASAPRPTDNTGSKINVAA